MRRSPSSAQASPRASSRRFTLMVATAAVSVVAGAGAAATLPEPTSAASSAPPASAAASSPPDEQTSALPTPAPPPAPTPSPAPAPSAAPTPSAPPTPSAQPATPAPPSASTAETLVTETSASLQRWADVAAAEADGYASIGDAITGYEHFVHWERAEDGVTLDPDRPESLVYEVGADGTRTLVSAMYLLPPGTTMDDVPDLGDDRAVWHDHDNLCWSEDRRIAGILVGDSCVPGGEPIPSTPMLHVWIVEHPCGPFAPLEGHGGRCTSAHGH